MDSKSIRYHNTRLLVDQVGGVTNFADRINKGQSQTSQFAGANPIKGIGNKVARQIEDAFGKSHGWLDTIHSGTDIDHCDQGKDSEIRLVSSNANKITPYLAPVLSWVQAGSWTNIHAVDMSMVEKWLPIPDSECTNCFYLIVKGASNYPEFLEGDYILVDPDVCYGDIQSGDMIVVRRGDDATFKKLVIETDGSRYLQALNPDFKPNILPINEEYTFIGEVVDCVRYVYRSKRRSRMPIRHLLLAKYEYRCQSCFGGFESKDLLATRVDRSKEYSLENATLLCNHCRNRFDSTRD